MSRGRTAAHHDSADRLSHVLNFIVDHAKNDERPYLKVDIVGRKFLGLLDSGATSTYVNQKGWTELTKLGFSLDPPERPGVKIANGQQMSSLGSCTVPIRVRDRVRSVVVTVLPDLAHTLVLGTKFWKQIGIVPDLRSEEWYFSDKPDSICSLHQVQGTTMLSEMQLSRLNAVLDRNRERMGSSLGCTNVAEHAIVSNSPPIKQRYYRVSPVMQKFIDQELNSMLQAGVVE